MPEPIFDQLIRALKRWPGIGPRQARRLAYWLASRPSAELSDLNRLLAQLPNLTATCRDCQRLFWTDSEASLCEHCRDTGRRDPKILVVEKDIDLDNIQKMSGYRGYFFVLGGLLPLNGDDRNLRLTILKQLIGRKIKAGQLNEIILALSASPEGDHTAEYVAESLRPILAETHITISGLGRGLSAGTELEYSDPDTLKSAWQNRQPR